MSGPALTRWLAMLAELLSAGVPLPRALGAIGGQGAPVARTLGKRLLRDIGDGRSFSESLGRHAALPPADLAVLENGEIAGALGEAVAALARLRETRHRFRGAVVSAAAYPLGVLALAAAVTWFFSLAVVPPFRALFADMRQPLPPAVTVLDFVGRAAPFLLAAAAGAAILPRGMRARGLNAAVNLVGRRPGFTAFIAPHVSPSWARGVAILVRGGTPPAEALTLSAPLASLPALENGIRKAALLVREGAPIGLALSRTTALPPVILEAALASDETGDIATAFDAAADALEPAAARARARVIACLGPAFAAMAAAVVALVATGLLTPLFHLSGAGL